MDTLRADFLFGLRALRRTPAFTAVAVLTLAIGIGATSAIFSIVNGTMLYGLPWSEPESIVSFRLMHKREGEARAMTLAQYRDFGAQAKSFEGLLATFFDQAYLTDREEARMVYAPKVTVGSLGLMGVEPLLGRGFTEAEGHPGAEPVIMLGEGLWRERYGADPSIVGRALELNGERATVVGVLADARWFPRPATEVLRPLAFDAVAAARDDDRYGIIGRLRPGVTMQEAQAEMDVIVGRLGERYPKTDGELKLELLASKDLVIDDAGRRGTLLLLGAAGFVLLIICGNLANLMLARSAARHKEMATRAAVGASRGRLMRLLLTECGVIALLSFPLSLLVTRVFVDYLLSLVPDSITYMEHFFRFDYRVAGFAAAVSGLTVVLFGLSPSLKASRIDLSESLKEGGVRGGTDSGSQRLRSTLVAGQIALALSLLVTASVFMQSLVKISRSDLGFDIQGALSATLLLPEGRYDGPPALRSFHGRLEDALSTLPQGARAALTSSAPLGWRGPERSFQIEGRRKAQDEQPPRAHWSGVSSEYFKTVGLRIVKGRGFAASDRDGALPVVVINQELADAYFADRDPIGQRIELSDLASMKVTGGSREIVGVVSSITEVRGLLPPAARPRLYEPLAQQPVQRVDIVLRSGGDPLASVGALRQRVKGLDARLSLAQTETMVTRKNTTMWGGDFFAKVMMILGLLALLLASVGIYGVVSYSTAQRTREFGIRAALGAEPGQIAALVLKKTLRLSLIGIGLGLLLALLLSRITETMLYGVDARSPATLAAVSAVLLAVSLLSSLVPVLRAVRAQPMEALRLE
ncbi:MAG: ABC transporter permease [Myxococcales bacterium]|nr:ABC transporter permease [Myxococcales bacterium]